MAKVMLALVLLGVGCGRFNPEARARKKAMKAGVLEDYDACVQNCNFRLSTCESGDSCSHQYKGCIRLCRSTYR
jgi:hypothetical protein